MLQQSFLSKYTLNAGIFNNFTYLRYDSVIWVALNNKKSLQIVIMQCRTQSGPQDYFYPNIDTYQYKL